MKTKQKNGKIVETLQAYVDPLNKIWLKKAAKKSGYTTSSKFLDHMLGELRKNGNFSAEV